MRFFLAIVCYLLTERYAKNSRTFSVSQSEYIQFSEFCLEGYKSEHGEGTNHPICNFSEIFAAVELLKKNLFTFPFAKTCTDVFTKHSI